jgi:hypothetical protein
MTKIKVSLIVIGLLLARTASAQVLISEIQISPTAQRFIELYNSGSSDIDLTGWYIQRKTATGDTFASLVSSTQLKSKIIKANSYFLISRTQLTNADVIVGDMTLTSSNTIRVRDSKGGDIDQVGWDIIADGKSYQKLSSGAWGVATPTLGAVNANTISTEVTTTNNQNTALTEAVVSISSQNSSAFPVEPQIFTDAGPATLTVSTGATVTFAGKAWGLKKEPIENARMVWAFGDGGNAEGTSVAHVFYYPGEYTVVLDTASGYYSASDRIRVTAVTPSLVVRAGGDTTRSFITIQNNGNEDLDLSSWQIESTGKKFVIPKNTFVSAKKTLTLASEVTGLSTPLGTNLELNFPNGTHVGMASPVVLTPTSTTVKGPAVNAALISHPSRSVAQGSSNQEASIVSAFMQPTTQSSQKGDGLWFWYTSAAFLGIFALLGIRFVQKREDKTTFTADDFEIIEDVDDFDENEPH